MIDDENPLIEGIGNEVLYVSSAFLGVAIALLCLSRRFDFSRFDLTHDASTDTTGQQRIGRYSSRFLNEADSNMSNIQHFGSDHQCPICLNEPRYPIETNCGHLFCAQCIILYWRHGNWIGTIRCPVCRQSVTVILRCFRDHGPLPEASSNQGGGAGGDDGNSNSSSTNERSRIIYDINDYNRRFSGEPRPWQDYLWDLPTLLRHVGSEFFSVGGLMYMFRLRIVVCFIAAILYLISPLDMIPEAVFGILGLLDDMFVVLLLAIYVTVIYRRFLRDRWQDTR